MGLVRSSASSSSALEVSRAGHASVYPTFGGVKLSVVFLDFETFYDTRGGYTLKKMSMAEYIRDPRFKVFGAGLGTTLWKGSKPEWFIGADLRVMLRNIDWSRTALCAQNVKFDGAILAWHYGIRPALYLDTKSMASAVLGTMTKDNSLGTLAHFYGLEPKGFLKTDGLATLTKEQEVELATYCLHDVELCRQIFERLAPRFPPEEFWSLDWTIRQFVNPSLRLDEAALQEAYDQEVKRRETIIQKACALIEADLPPMPFDHKLATSKKMFSSNVLFPQLLKRQGFEVPMKPSPSAAKKGETKMIPALAVGDSDFQDLLESDNGELVTLCEARVAAKSNLLETRSAKYLAVAKTGAWPFDMNYSGAKQTHRYSGGSGGGGNPQNLTKKSALRQAVCVPEDYELGVGDFAGIELRLAAWLSQETRLMSAISEGRDVYSEFASKLFERPITKADADERQFGKCAILGLGYGMGWKKFIYTVRLQTGKVIDGGYSHSVVDLYRSTYDQVQQYWYALGAVIPKLASGEPWDVPNAPFLKIRNGAIILPSGLELRYPNLRIEGKEWVYDIWRNRRKETTKLYGGKLLENICQALAGELTKLAIRRLEEAGIPCVGQVHDEILALLAKADKERLLCQFQATMETPPPWWPQLVLKAEVGAGKNWGEAKV